MNVVRYTIRFLRAAYRFLFIDFKGEGLMSATFVPSSEQRVIISPTDDPDDAYYDTTRGENLPGIFLPPLLLLMLLTCWAWGPIALWFALEDKRERFWAWVDKP